MGRTVRLVRIRCRCKCTYTRGQAQSVESREEADQVDECRCWDADFGEDLFRIFNFDLVHVKHGRKLLDHLWDIHSYRGSDRDVSYLLRYRCLENKLMG